MLKHLFFIALFFICTIFGAASKTPVNFIKRNLRPEEESSNKRQKTNGPSLLSCLPEGVSKNKESVDLMLKLRKQSSENKNEMLIQAVAKDNEMDIRMLTGAGANVNAFSTNETIQKEWRGLLPITIAAKKGNVPLVALLKKLGATNDALNEGDDTPIIHLVRHKNTDALDILLAQNFDVNSKNKCLWTALHYAARDKQINIINKLITKGAKVDATAPVDNWRQPGTPLSLAVNNDHELCAQALLKNNADPNISIDSEPVLKWCQKNKNPKILKALVNSKRMNKSILNNELFKATKRDDLEIIEILIDAGASIDAATENGWTPLHFITRHGSVESLNALLKHKPNIDAATENGWTPLSLAVEFSTHEQVEALLEKNADPNISIDSEPVLKWCLKNTKIKTFKALVNSKRMYEYRLTQGLFQAIKNHNLKAIKILIDAGANINARKYNNGNSILHKAAKSGNIEIIKILQNADVYPNPHNANGTSVLYFAANNEVRNSLIQAGATPSRCEGLFSILNKLVQ